MSGGQETNGLLDRPKKRRKVNNLAVTKANDELPFVPLFAGNEDIDFSQSRYDSFKANWQVLEDSLEVGRL